VTAAIEATSITSVFLDECLHMFFVRFIPTFPVLHRATFVFRECTQPLLLNAMAIGSLYLGPKDSIAKVNYLIYGPGVLTTLLTTDRERLYGGFHTLQLPHPYVLSRSTISVDLII
jgi:hypothetical protein